MVRGEIGMLTTPADRRSPSIARYWAADNGCFNAKTYVGDERWIEWLGLHALYAPRCLFAVAPDVVGDAAATLARSRPWLPVIRSMGYPAAFVAQDGQQDLPVPWDEFDVLFIGGSDDFKLGPDAARLALQAKGQGKRVHMGRVNSYKRMKIAANIGCDTADGTFLAFGPAKNIVRVRGWMEKLRDEGLAPVRGVRVVQRPVAAKGRDVSIYVKVHNAQTNEDYESWAAAPVSRTLNLFDTGDTRATTIIITDEDSMDDSAKSKVSIPEPPMGECGCCPADPKPDSSRYRACGNAVTVNVAQWIGERLLQAL